MKLFPLLALNYAMVFTFLEIKKIFITLMKEAEQSNFEKIQIMHHLTSGLKSLCTQRGIEGLYTARQSIGGAGMTEWSGIPAVIAFLGPSITYEGDNSVMAQQSFRYLKKVFKSISDPNENDQQDYSVLNYLREAKVLLQKKNEVNTVEAFANLEQVDQTLKVCTAATVAQVMQKLAKSKAPTKEKTNFLFANEIINTSLCHMKYVVFKYFQSGLEQLPDERLKVHLRNLCALLGLCFTQECMTAGYDSGYLNQGDNGRI